jgi:hypothetical protein
MKNSKSTILANYIAKISITEGHINVPERTALFSILTLIEGRYNPLRDALKHQKNTKKPPKYPKTL